MSTSWTFRRIDGRAKHKDGFGYVSDAEGRDILHVGERSLSEAENVAVGLMAAAAPDLLKAAQLLGAAEGSRDGCEECDGEGEPEACGKCFPAFDDARVARRNAIAKATGAPL